MKVESESEVAQSYPTLSDPMDCSLPGSSVHGIFQARVLECHCLLQGSVPTQGSNPHVLHFLHWQAGFLTTSATCEALCAIGQTALHFCASVCSSIKGRQWCYAPTRKW